ncbi:MAG: hypothetical protein HKN26_06350, partial [Acidimicrobiales bacterium]|nr:hypothetical protein [Acidimicrobiales bacterium]
ALFATAADGDVGNYGAGLSTESWNPDATLSVIDVRSVEWTNRQLPPVDVLFYPTECSEDDTPTYDETIVPDLDFDGQRERWIARTCDAGAGQVVEYFLVNSGVERQTNFMGEGTLRIESADGTLFVYSLDFAAADPLCCPSLRTETHYIWNGLGLEETFSETGPALAQLDFATIAETGEDPDEVVARVVDVLGDPTADSGWGPDEICFGQRRTVSWGDLSLLFHDSDQPNYRGYTGAWYTGPVPALNGPLAIGQSYSGLVAGQPDIGPLQNDLPYGNYAVFDDTSSWAGVVVVFDDSPEPLATRVIIGDDCGD